MKIHDRMKIFFWIFFGVCVALIIGIVILNAVLAVYYVKGDMPEWAKGALVTFAVS